MEEPRPVIIGDRTVRNFEFLYRLGTCTSPKKRWQMMNDATRDQLLAIVDICANLMRKPLKLKSKQRKRMEKHWDFVRKMSRVRSPTSAMKIIQKGEGISYNPKGQIRVQSGGALPAILIPILAEVAASGVEYVLSKLDI